MIVEYHAIQSFAPANLNRDDAGTPKSCTFGGVRRARVSSQAWKRAIRMQFGLPASGIATGVRTKRSHQAIVERLLAADSALEESQARHRAAVVLEAEPLGLSFADLKEEAGGDQPEIKTKQLIFFREEDLDVLAGVATEFAAEIDKLTPTVGRASDSEESTDDKRAAVKKPLLPKEAAKRIKEAFAAPGTAVDVALFGRMLAEMPEANIDAACQVAHAIGTHRLSSEHDYYTAVDDRQSADTEGADMIGAIEFNASCLYRYAALDFGQLASNLGPTVDQDELRAIVGAFTSAFALSAPSGKQNTFAAHNLPACLLVTVRSTGAWNLANAFVDPIGAANGNGGLAAGSVRGLCEQFRKTEKMFGRREEPVSGAVLSEESDLDWGSNVIRVANLEALGDWDFGVA